MGKKSIIILIVILIFAAASIALPNINLIKEFPFKDSYNNQLQNGLNHKSYYYEKRLAELSNYSGYIVEFNSEPLFIHKNKVEQEISKIRYVTQSEAQEKLSQDLKSYTESLAEEHSKFKNLISDINSGSGKQTASFSKFSSIDRISFNYYKIFNGVSIEGNLTEEELLLILSQDYVKNVYPNRKVHVLMNESKDIINATPVYSLLDSDGMNITGENVTIAIIDTGVDYTHQDFGSCTTEQFLDGSCTKVRGGYDFINFDNDPMDDYGHGTHCAGIAAANGTNITGVASAAIIYAYKVFDEYGYGTSSEVIAAIENATDPDGDGDNSDHVDIISMSLGGSGEPEDAMSTAVNNAVDSGILVVVAAGNDGPANNTISCPGCAAKALTVGALYKQQVETNLYARLYSVNDSNQSIQANPSEYSNTTGLGGITKELVYAGLGYPENFTGNDFNDKIALIERGVLYFYEKVNNAKNANASGVIIYNNGLGNFLGTLSNQSSLPVVSISDSDGQYFLDLMDDNNTIYVNLIVANEEVIIADFSSRGPAFIYNKPDIVAPGVLICSTFLSGFYSDSLCLDDYHQSMSGTSMATPMVAGSAALIKQKHRDWSPLQIKAAIEYTAKDLGLDRNIQGAGRIDVFKAVNLSRPPPVAFLRKINNIFYEYD